jgi:DNA gyrase/topoisomerase IV subunit A
MPLQLGRAKQLNQQLQAERLRLEQKVVIANDTQAEIELLQKDEKDSADELMQYQDQKTTIDFEVDELLKQERETEALLQVRCATSDASLFVLRLT